MNSNPFLLSIPTRMIPGTVPYQCKELNADKKCHCSLCQTNATPPCLESNGFANTWPRTHGVKAAFISQRQKFMALWSFNVPRPS